MESDTNQGKVEDGEQNRVSFLDKFTFLKYLKGRLIDYVHPETKKRYTGHVAMYYKNTGRIRIDWDDGLTTYHNFEKDTKWIFRVKKIKGSKL